MSILKQKRRNVYTESKGELRRLHEENFLSGKRERERDGRREEKKEERKNLSSNTRYQHTPTFPFKAPCKSRKMEN